MLKLKKTQKEELNYLAELENDSFEVNAKYFEISINVVTRLSEWMNGIKKKNVGCLFLRRNVRGMKMIETERLLLRPFTKNDAGDVFEYLHEPLVNCFACMKLNTMEDAKEEVENRAKDIEYYFAIVLKDTGKVIGEIVAHPETHTPEEDNVVLDTFSPCWMLNKDYQGKGYAYEAAYAYFDYLFSQKGARRIYAYTEDYNLSSQHLCEKLGMRREGMFMEFVSFINDAKGNPIYENTIQYAILKKEWIK